MTPYQLRLYLLSPKIISMGVAAVAGDLTNPASVRTGVNYLILMHKAKDRVVQGADPSCLSEVVGRMAEVAEVAFAHRKAVADRLPFLIFEQVALPHQRVRMLRHKGYWSNVDVWVQRGVAERVSDSEFEEGYRLATP